MKSNRSKGRVLAIIQFILLFLIIASALIEYTHHDRAYSSTLHIISILLIVLGLVTAILTLIEFRQYMTPNPYPLDNAKLRTGGMYSLVRHPMYFSVIVLIFGGTMFLRSYFTLILDFLAVLFLIFKISFEERMLMEKFPEYEDYKKKTKKLIPFIY